MGRKRYCSQCKKKTRVDYHLKLNITICKVCKTPYGPPTNPSSSKSSSVPMPPSPPVPPTKRLLHNPSSSASSSKSFSVPLPLPPGPPTNPSASSSKSSSVPLPPPGPPTKPLLHNPSSSASASASTSNTASSSFDWTTIKNDIVLYNLSEMCRRLGLSEDIENRALHICYKYTEGQDRKDSSEAIPAACIYIACNEKKEPRTERELAMDIAQPDPQELKLAVRRITADQTLHPKTIKAADLLRRFCSNLGIMNGNAMLKAALETAINDDDDRRIQPHPESKAAAIIYMVTQLSESPITLQDISANVNVPEAAIQTAYQVLLANASKIIPSWYAKEEDFAKLRRI